MTPDASLNNRQIGNDFSSDLSWRMYQGQRVPGFPAQPHRGFEAITIVETGYVDHCDSLGSAARFGPGDVQWITTGCGMQYSEMFPMLSTMNHNDVDLFHIRLNLPAQSKLVQPQFGMLWKEAIPVLSFEDAENRKTTVTVCAGSLDNTHAPSPPPHSWASDYANGICIWRIDMAPNAVWSIPACAPEINRCLYFVEGNLLTIGRVPMRSRHAIELTSDCAILKNGAHPARLLYLQGKPIGEPVASHESIVMNTEEEIETALQDFRSTGFGGWPWPSDEYVHPKDKSRFALHLNGVEETRKL